MNELDVRLRNLDKVARASLGEVSGVIDTSTLEEFEAKVSEALRGGAVRLVFDFSKVRFVNSSGLGVLVKANDSLREMGGGIALIRVPAKIRLVIEMLGLDTYFTLRESEEEALFALGASAEAPGRGRGGMPSTPTTVTTCGSCGLLITLPEPGSYRCPRCFAGVICSEDGETSFWVPEDVAPTVLTFPCTAECTEGIVGFVQAYLKKLGYAGERVREVEGAFREIGGVLRERVHEDGDRGVCHLKVQAQAMSVEFEITDGGRTLPREEVEAVFKRARSVSDGFSCTPHPLGGNIIKFTKRK